MQASVLVRRRIGDIGSLQGERIFGHDDLTALAPSHLPLQRIEQPVRASQDWMLWPKTQPRPLFYCAIRQLFPRRPAIRSFRLKLALDGTEYQRTYRLLQNLHRAGE